MASPCHLFRSLKVAYAEKHIPSLDPPKDFKNKNTRKHVRFANQSQACYFLSHRPASNINGTHPSELMITSVEPIDICRSTWLEQPSLLRQEPYCQLDYLCVSNDSEWPSIAEEPLFHLDQDQSKQCSSLQVLVGEVAVFNLEFAKQVIIHYTVNNWRTKQIARARYKSSISALRIDKFLFYIQLFDQRLLDATLSFAIEYAVGGKSYWDSHNGQNYKFKITLTPLVCSDEIVKVQDEDDYDYGIQPARMDEISHKLITPSIIIPGKKLTHILPATISLTNMRNSWSSVPVEHPSILPSAKNPTISKSAPASWNYTKSLTLAAAMAIVKSNSQINGPEAFVSQLFFV